MRLSELQQLFSRDIVRLLIEMENRGFKYTFGEAMRTPEQAEIYAKSGKGIKNSLHCKKLAIDINLFSQNNQYLQDTKDYEQFGIFWEDLSPGNRWGGRFKRADGTPFVDANHFERNDKPGI